MQISELKTVTTLVREMIENVVSESTYVDVELQNFPSGACEVSSVILGLYLKEKYDVNVVVLSVGKRPSPHCEYSENNHVWLTVNESVVVDITADQFDDFLSKVFVGHDSTFHDTFEVYDTRSVVFNDLLRRGSAGYVSIYKEVETRCDSRQKNARIARRLRLLNT